MSPDLPIRPVTPDEVLDFTRAPLTAFGETFDEDQFKLEWTHHELDRTLAAFDDGEIVGTGRLYSLELTLPGGRLEPVAAVSWISVLPTHRRRGILTAIMRRHLDDAVRRGESMAVLHASEGAIYRRFGYGVATWGTSATLERRHSSFVRPVATSGRVRLIDEDTARKVLPEIFDRVRRGQPGAISRVDQWWPNEFFHVPKKEQGARYFATYESGGRSLEGYAAYKIEPKWEDGALPENRLEVFDIMTATPEARLALWRYLCDIDLVNVIKIETIPIDEPLRWLLAEARRLQVTRISDELWVRILDTPAALSAREYAADIRLVLEVTDPFRPNGAAAGRFALDTRHDRTSVARTEDPADLALEVADLGAAYLGGVSFSTLARAGLVEERTPGALARADVMFEVDRAPAGLTWF